MHRLAPDELPGPWGGPPGSLFATGRRLWTEHSSVPVTPAGTEPWYSADPIMRMAQNSVTTGRRSGRGTKAAHLWHTRPSRSAQGPGCATFKLGDGDVTQLDRSSSTPRGGLAASQRRGRVTSLGGGGDHHRDAHVQHQVEQADEAIGSDVGPVRDARHRPALAVRGGGGAMEVRRRPWRAGAQQRPVAGVARTLGTPAPARLFTLPAGVSQVEIATDRLADPVRRAGPPTYGPPNLFLWRWYGAGG